MQKINSQLIKYIETKIFPIYESNDPGHGIDHIRYVIERSLLFARQFSNIDSNMVYTIASFHDIAHHIDKNNHEILSAKLFYENEMMKNFFNDEQRIIIKEAIEDHRASSKDEPRSDYGKIVSSADRNTSIDSIIKRTYMYALRHYKELELTQIIDQSYNHICEKYGKGGYAKNYCVDEDYEKFKQDVEVILKDKWEFIRKYLEINEITDLKEKAKIFAINAHSGQVRKNEPDKPMIIHPISVGMLLENYKCDDSVVAAGYLHDVVEDTKYTVDDIRNEFGDDIAKLVMGASEPDKSLSWEERKKHTIEETKNLPLRNKFVICADKINNLEDLMIKFQKSGIRDFSAFKRDEEKQKWYYTSIYESLIYGEDEKSPIFERLKNVLDIVFYGKEDLYLKDTIFADNSDYYEKLKRLHAQKIELQKLKSLCTLVKPFVIEFSGTPRTGKTTTIKNLYDFFKKAGFNTVIIEEFTTSKYFKNEFREKYKNVSSCEFHIAIIEEVTRQLEDILNSDNEIILIDRSINDRQIWNYRRYARGDMSEDIYQELKEKYRLISNELIDFLVVTYAESLTSLKRDYNSLLSLEKRNFLNVENLDEYNKCLRSLDELFKSSVEDMVFLDTTSIDLNDVSVEVTSRILPAIRKKYIKNFEQKYSIK